MQVTQAAKGQQAFYRSNNSGYGTEWQAGQTNDPAEVPQYRDLVSLQLLLFFEFCNVLLICRHYFEIG